MQISRRTFYILIGIIALILVGVVGWFIIKQQSAPTNSSEGNSVRDFFPFGKPAETRQEPSQTGKPATPPATVTETVTPVSEQRLRKVWANPVAGYTLFDKDVPVNPATAAKDQEKTVTPTYTLTKTLSSGSVDPEVKELEKVLNQCPETQVATTGAGSPGKEGTQFTAKTKAALIKFQEKFSAELLEPLNRTTGTGTLDTLTRAKINKPWSCTLIGVAPKTEKRPVARFVERANGNIYDAYANTLETKRLTNTTIPRIAEAFFVNSGSQVLLRYVRDDNQTIDTYLATLPRENWGQNPTAGTLTGTFLEPTIADVSVSPDKKQVFLLTSFSGGVLGISGNPDGSSRKQVFSSPFTGWLGAWPTSTTILLTTKATGYAPGYAFRLSPTEKTTPEKILGPVIGLTTLPAPGMQSVLFSRNTNTGPRLGLFNPTTAAMRDLPIQTLPEKCVWTKDGSTIFCGVPNIIPTDLVMPDSWYQGEVAFSDTIVKIDKEGILPTRTLIDPGTIGEYIDAINLQVADDGTALYFINKRDGILWQLKL